MRKIDLLGWMRLAGLPLKDVWIGEKGVSGYIPCPDSLGWDPLFGDPLFWDSPPRDHRLDMDYDKDKMTLHVGVARNTDDLVYHIDIFCWGALL